MAYVFPAVATWGIIGLICWVFSDVPVMIVFLAFLYVVIFGGLETLGLPFRAPSLAWQVPARWIQGKSIKAQAIIWGTLLGPGLVTRNPYAGIWVLPLLLALHQHIIVAVALGMVVGITHGGARALGVISNRRQMNARYSPMQILTAQWRWRYIDGLALLFLGGMLGATILMQVVARL